MNKRITLKDVAKAAGVSVPVVSVAINGTTGGTTSVSDELRDRILEIAEEMDYRPNLTAKSLRGNKSFQVGVLFNSDIPLPVYEGIQRKLKSKNYAPIFLCHSSTEEEQENIRFCMDRNVDAVIISSVNDTNKDLKDFPVVEIFSSAYENSSRVNFDYSDAFEKLTRHLLNLGHEEIACQTENPEAVAGYSKSVKSFGSREWILTNGSLPNEVTGIISTGDVNVPEGVSYATVEFSEEQEKTHIYFDYFRLAEEAVELTLELIDKEPNHNLLVQGEIKVLNSTSVPE